MKQCGSKKAAQPADEADGRLRRPQLIGDPLGLMPDSMEEQPTTSPKERFDDVVREYIDFVNQQ